MIDGSGISMLEEPHSTQINKKWTRKRAGMDGADAEPARILILRTGTAQPSVSALLVRALLVPDFEKFHRVAAKRAEHYLPAASALFPHLLFLELSLSSQMHPK